MPKVAFGFGSFVALAACAFLAAWLRPFNVKMPASVDMIAAVVVGKALLTFEVSGKCKQFWNGILCGMIDSALTLIALILIPIVLDLLADSVRSANAVSTTVISLLAGATILPTLVATGLVSLRN